MNIEDKAKLNAKNILINNYKIESQTKVMIIYDDDSRLGLTLKNGFEKALEELDNEFELVDFNKIEAEKILENLENNYDDKDVVVLIQSTSFRVSKYRWRNELCDRGFKVVEFGHLKNMDEEIEAFVESITDDFEHYEKISKKLVEKIGKAKEIKIISTDGSELKYSGPMDKCMRNTGALWEQTNWSTRYPIGEVISESLDLKTLNGEFLGYAYPSTKIITTYCEPFKCVVKDGFLISNQGPEEFQKIIEMIKTENERGDVYVREFGLGLNRHIKRDTKLSDPLAYERVEGLHFSLGMKHGMYQKKLVKEFGKKFYQRYHIDLYVDIKEMYMDDVLVYTIEKGYF